MADSECEPTIAGDPETLAMMQRLEATLFDAPQRPVRVGRFALERVLGSGGMGVVHLGYDDVLDRRLAIKLIRGERVASNELRVRLLREARAMARLSHANVVQVYEAGEHEGHVFVAMELVEGGTMASWLHAEGNARPWRERLAVLIAAGQGLAAAHRAGLVHRDFKPDNVLLDASNGAKVADFGLAGVTLDVQSTLPSPSGIEPLTVTGSLVGTPSYMAPEQLMGRSADARSDQFAFCIVAYEALVGQRPFSGETFAELSDSVISGAVRSVPRDCRVPRWLLAVIERGLEPDPARRWPSMDALLAAVTRRRTRAPMVAAVVLLAAVPGLAIASQSMDTGGPSCDGASTRLAGVWDSARHEQTRAVFLASGKAFAADTFVRIAPVLDDYASAWAEADLGACLSARAGDPAAASRSACLDHARTELQFVTDDLSIGEPHAVLHAVDLVGALPDLVRCEDPERAVLDVGSLENPEISAVVDGLGRANVLLASRRLAEADALLLELQTQAAAHRRDALEGRALLLRSKADYFGAAYERSHEHAANALALAERAERDEITVDAWRSLAHASRGRGDRERAAFELDRAESIAARTETDPGTRGDLLYDRATVLGELGRHGDAIAEFHRSLADFRAVNPEHPRIADVLSDLATNLLMAGRQDEAIAAMEESLAMRARQQGDLHPTMKIALSLAANHYGAAGRFEDALRMHLRAFEIAKLYPEDQPAYIPVLAALAGQSLVSLGRFDEAQQMLEQAEELATKYASSAKDLHGHIDMTLGNLHLDRRQYALAVSRYESALAVTGESAWENRASGLGNLAHALAGLGRIDEALARSAEARASAANLAPDSPLRVGIEIYDGEVQRIAGRTDAARTIFQEMLGVLDRVEVDASLRFMAYFGAARVERDRELASAHAEKAAAALEQMPSAAWQHEEFASWLAEHRR